MGRLLLCLYILILPLSVWPQEFQANEDIYHSLDVVAEVLALAEEVGDEQNDVEKVAEGAIQGLLEQLDPHSSYFNANRFKTMQEDQRGAFFGVGLIVGMQNGKLTVITPIDGTPAAKAGIRPGDVLLEIEGHSTLKMDLSDAVRHLRGDHDSTARVKILRKRDGEINAFVLKRQEIPSQNVRASFMLNETTGYVALKDFGESATSEMEQVLAALETQGMKQLLLDLRGNPGGLLPQAIGVAGLFLPGKKTVVSTKGRLVGSAQDYTSPETSPIKQLPLIVLIDRGSASASEIVAGAIQDHDRGLILGVNSWGKGLVQSVFPLAGGSRGLALTSARYYTPSGRNIQGDYESLENYYNPKPENDLYFSEAESPRSKGAQFKTVHGRVVYEVRGITPDVYITYPETPEIIRALDDDTAAFFDFIASYKDFPVKEEWVADETLIAAFKSFLTERKIPFDESEFQKNCEEIRFKLTYNKLYTVKPAWAWRALIQNDLHTKLALELFDEAAELLQVYHGEKQLRPEYTKELKRYSKFHQPLKKTP